MLGLSAVVLLVAGKLKGASLFALGLFAVMVALVPVVFGPLAILAFLAVLFTNGGPFFHWLNGKMGKGGKPNG